MISTDELAEVFVDLADNLVDDFDAIDFLHDLTAHAASISGADAVVLMLDDHLGQLHYLASSHETAAVLDLFQLRGADGPSVDCYATGKPIVDADLSAAAQRWPTFAPAAVEAGIHSVHAFPMKLRDTVIGVMNLCGPAESDYTAADQRVLQALAAISTIAILQHRGLTRAEALSDQLQGALNSRVIIEQAKGAIAQLEGTSADEAFQILRTRARASQRRLTDVAAELLEAIATDQPIT
ncbi:GAF and ANTAR domain-containing protein [Knoellia sp. S7-12]|uniref:GAF and ANTAR domain-containing protein n=1 Tax=Knoellia sp. S7-12 TaxID=3126698 RepID=UPI003366E5C8